MGSLDATLVEALFERYAFQVERRCHRLLRQPEEARDVAQEVFVRLITHGGDFRGEAEWMTWLYRVATNLCLNRIRNAARRDQAWSDELARAFEAPPMPDVRVQHRDTLATLFSEVDEATQQIAVLYYHDGLTQQEVGDVMGLSRVTVNKRLKQLERVTRTRDVEAAG